MYREKILLACYQLELSNHIMWLQQPAEEHITVQFLSKEPYLTPGPMMEVARELEALALLDIDRELALKLKGLSDKIADFQDFTNHQDKQYLTEQRECARIMYDLMSQFRTVDLGKIDRVIQETNTSNQGKVWSWFHGATRNKGKGLSHREWLAEYRSMDTEWVDTYAMMNAAIRAVTPSDDLLELFSKLVYKHGSSKLIREINENLPFWDEQYYQQYCSPGTNNEHDEPTKPDEPTESDEPTEPDKITKIKTEPGVNNAVYADEIAQANEATRLVFAGIPGPTRFTITSNEQNSSDENVFTSTKGAKPFSPFTISSRRFPIPIIPTL